MATRKETEMKTLIAKILRKSAATTTQLPDPWGIEASRRRFATAGWSQ